MRKAIAINSYKPFTVEGFSKSSFSRFSKIQPFIQLFYCKTESEIGQLNSCFEAIKGYTNAIGINFLSKLIIVIKLHVNNTWLKLIKSSSEKQKLPVKKLAVHHKVEHQLLKLKSLKQIVYDSSRC